MRRRRDAGRAPGAAAGSARWPAARSVVRARAGASRGGRCGTRPRPPARRRCRRRHRPASGPSSSRSPPPGPSCTPTRSSRANAVSISSFTGVVSGSVTSTTWQRAGSASIARHVERLGVDRSAAHGVEQAARRQQERDRVPGRRPVDHDQVVLAAAFELLQLAQHHDVVDAGCGGGHHVDHTAAGQALRDPRAARGRRGTRPARPCADSASTGDAVAHQRARAWACRRARRRAPEVPIGLPHAPEQPLPWSSPHRPCRPRRPTWWCGGTAVDPGASEALVRRLAITALLAAPLVAAGRAVAARRHGARRRHVQHTGRHDAVAAAAGRCHRDGRPTPAWPRSTCCR